MGTYSKELIDRTIEHFAEEHNHHISEEIAIEYLDSMAGLYLAFSKQTEKDSTG